MLARALAVAIPVFLADRITKYWVVEALDLRHRLFIPVLDPWLNFTMAWNEGINFGLLDMGGAGYQIWLAAPDKGRVVIKFKDNGAHAKTKKLKRGDSVKLSGCSVSGKTTRAVHMSDCRLAS